MSGDKKRSSFQITSVTLDYGQATVDPSQMGAFSEYSDGPLHEEEPQQATVGEQGTEHTSSPTSMLPSASPVMERRKRVAEASGEPGGSAVPSPTSPSPSNGYLTDRSGGGGEGNCRVELIRPVLLDLPKPGQPSSSSQPCTPKFLRRQVSVEQAGAQFSPPSPSRFRVVRLGQGLGEPYYRGRWTCTDFLERDGPEKRGLRLAMESMRHAHSLDSLEVVELGVAREQRGEAVLSPLAHAHALKTRQQDNPQSSMHTLAPHVGSSGGTPGKPPTGEEVKADSLAMFRHPAATLPSDISSPTDMDQFNVKLEDVSSSSSLSRFSRAMSLQHQPHSPLLSASSPLSDFSHSQHIPAGLHLDLNILGKPESLATPLCRDRDFQQDVSPNQTTSAFSLAQSMFGVGGAFDPDSESGSSKRIMAIDSKIEQAMDLVKTHLMLAVREEVELLREQIMELTERNAQLERENYILRTLKERD